MAEYVRIIDGIVTEMVSTNDGAPKKGEWREVDGSTFDGDGLPENWIDWKTSMAKDEKTLVAEGLAKDTRGLVVYEKATGQPFKVRAFNFQIPETHTDKAPSGPADRWNEASSEWEEDPALAKTIKKALAVDEARRFLSETQDDADESIEEHGSLKAGNPKLFQQRQEARGTIKENSK